MIDGKDRISEFVINTYSDINCIDIIKDILTLRGTEQYANKRIPLKELVDNAIVLYELKNNSTNILNVTYYIEKSIRQNDIIIKNKIVNIPDNIYNEIKQINKEFIHGK